MAVFTILSETHQNNSAIKDLFGFLNDFKNFHAILPEDKVDNFKYSENDCSFNIKGITAMKVKKLASYPYKSIIFSSEGLGKFNFELKVVFEGDEVSTGQSTVEMTADLNPFIKTMAEKPLTALVNTMSLRLSELKLN